MMPKKGYFALCLAVCAALPLAALQGLRMEEEAPTCLTGRVIDATTGEPVAGALVALLGNDSARLQTDAAGSFLFSAFTSDQVATVRIFKGGYQPLDVQASPSFETLNVKLTPRAAPVAEVAPVAVQADSVYQPTGPLSLAGL